MLHELLLKFGIYYAKRRYMAKGIDWVWDLRRLNVANGVPLVLDVGSNEGQTTASILQSFPGAKIHAFEPVGRTFAVYQQKFGASPQVVSNHVALSSSPGLVHMHACDNCQLSHIVTASSDLAAVEGIEPVEATTIDDYASAHKIQSIDILKTDTEGHDLEVLRGADGLLRSNSISWVLAEVTFDPTDEADPQFEEIRDLLARRGMRVYGFYYCYYEDSGNSLLFCNVLFNRVGQA